MILFWSVYGDSSDPTGNKTDQNWALGRQGGRKAYTRSNCGAALAAGFTEVVFQPWGSPTGAFSCRLMSLLPEAVLKDLCGDMLAWLRQMHPNATLAPYVGAKELLTASDREARELIAHEIVPVALMMGARRVWFDALDPRTPQAKAARTTLARYGLDIGYEPTPLGGEPYGTAIVATGRRTMTSLSNIRTHYPGLRVLGGEDYTAVIDDPNTTPAELEAVSALGWKLGAASIVGNQNPALLDVIAAQAGAMDGSYVDKSGGGG